MAGLTCRRAHGRPQRPARLGVPAARQEMTSPRAAREWHAESGDEVLRALDSTPSGLSDDEARARLATHGPNRLPQAAGPSAAGLLLAQVRSPLMYALLLSAAVAAAFGELEDAAVVLAVVVLNTIIGFLQEYRAGRAIAALADL